MVSLQIIVKNLDDKHIWLKKPKIQQSGPPLWTPVITCTTVMSFCSKLILVFVSVCVLSEFGSKWTIFEMKHVTIVLCAYYNAIIIMDKCLWIFGILIMLHWEVTWGLYNCRVCWRFGRVDAFRPKGHGFDCRSSRHPVALRREIPAQYTGCVGSASEY